jgi:hypothetical protein
MLKDPQTVSGAVLAGLIRQSCEHDKALLTLNGIIPWRVSGSSTCRQPLVVAAGKANRYPSGGQTIEDPVPHAALSWNTRHLKDQL